MGAFMYIYIIEMIVTIEQVIMINCLCSAKWLKNFCAVGSYAIMFNRNCPKIFDF